MLSQTRFTHFALAALALCAACSDDDKKEIATDNPSATIGDGGAGTANESVDPGIDGGGDRGSIDGSLVIPGTITLPDGAVVGVDVDAGAAADGAVVGTDGALVGAGGDAATSPCDVNDPRYGCGIRSGADWVSFDDFEIDLKNKIAWTKPVTVVDDDHLAGICPKLNAGGFSWYLPQMKDVRSLAAGCDKTVPGGSCQVYQDQVYSGDAGDCACPEGLVGPNEGKFCRPEVPECETFWVWTHTDETGGYEHWFYDVTTGSIVREFVAVGIALRAKGRCVHALTDSEVSSL